MSELIKNSDKTILSEGASQKDIIKYIKEKRLINFRYDSPVPGQESNEGYYRNCELYVLGVSKAGNLVVRAWQTNSSSSTHPNELPGWRMFRLDGISEILPVNQKFDADVETLNRTRPKYNENDRDMVRIIISILPLNPDDQNKIKNQNTITGNKVKTMGNQKSFFKNQEDDFATKQVKRKKAAKEKSVFSGQHAKFKIPAKKPMVNRSWMKNKYSDFVNKQLKKERNK